MFVPGVAENLFSVSRATELGAEFVFKRGVCQVFMRNEVVLRVEQKRGPVCNLLAGVVLERLVLACERS